MLGEFFNALVVGMGLTPRHVKLLIRIGWVLLVSMHIAWVCGWLAAAGLASPFAQASDVAELKANSKLMLTLQLQQELRSQKTVWCQITDENVRVSVMNRIDQLRQNLREVAKIDDGVGEPRCLLR